jgi:hypothetical protein
MYVHVLEAAYLKAKRNDGAARSADREPQDASALRELGYILLAEEAFDETIASPSAASPKLRKIPSASTYAAWPRVVPVD